MTHADTFRHCEGDSPETNHCWNEEVVTIRGCDERTEINYLAGSQIAPRCWSQQGVELPCDRVDLEF